MPRRAAWQEQLRRTTALSRLEEGRYDLFPLQEVQALTDSLVKAANRSSILRRGSERLLDDDVVRIELRELRGELHAEEAGIIACLHVISPELATALLVDLRQRCEVVDEFFLHQIRAYLQCLILACQVQPEFFHPDISIIAKDLFQVAKRLDRDESFPSVVRVLKVVGDEQCEEFLPMTLVRSILKYVEYQKNLEKELQELVKDRRWFLVHELVGGLRGLDRVPAAARLIPVAFLHVAIWASWAPDCTRLRAWENHILDPYRSKLAPVFDLEGPDMTGNQLRTLRESNAGIYGFGVYGLPPSNGRYILDHLLTTFDRAVHKGIEAVRLFIALCVEPKKIDWPALDRMEAALELAHPSHIQSLYDCMHVVKGHDLLARMQAVASVIPVIRSTRRLQHAFRNAGDLAHRGPHILSAAQRELGEQLRTGQASERFAVNVSILGHALHSAEWLHENWHERYIKMLRQIPKEIHISATFRMMRTGSPELANACRDVLWAKLCASNRKGSTSKAASALQIITPGIVEDPVWSQPLDQDRSSLRDLLLRDMMQGFDPSDATACLQQAFREHDIFVRELRNLVAFDDSDFACVKLASSLGPRCLTSGRRANPPADCWRRLLMYMMRRRPPGLLERCAETLATRTWQDWIRHLGLLYGERHFDPEGGLGFTPEKFHAATARKLGVGRTISQSTYSTNSTRSSGGMTEWY